MIEAYIERTLTALKRYEEGSPEHNELLVQLSDKLTEHLYGLDGLFE